MNKVNIFFSPSLWLVVCLTLGLAPFLPEPHVWEKLKWILSGAQGMKLIDWFDLFMHGTPWILLLVTLLAKTNKNKM